MKVDTAPARIKPISTSTSRSLSRACIVPHDKDLMLVLYLVFADADAQALPPHSSTSPKGRQGGGLGIETSPIFEIKVKIKNRQEKIQRRKKRTGPSRTHYNTTASQAPCS
jgi:hypothetical protein